MDKIEWQREVSSEHREAYEDAKRDFHSLAECPHTAIKEIPAMVQALRDHVAQYDGWSDYELNRRADPATIARFKRDKAILASIDGADHD